MLFRDILMAAASQGGGVRAPDFYVDSVSGNDANDGTTLATAWASLNKINSITLSNSLSRRVAVKSGTYDKSTDYISSDMTAVSNCVLVIVFEPGCVIDGTNYGVNINALQMLGATSNYTNTLRVYGNGCIVRNVTTATGNGIGGTNGGTAYYYDFQIESCVDGFSVHGDHRAYLYDSHISACTKSTYGHINTTRTGHYRCTFDNSANTAVTAGIGIGVIQSDAISSFEDCIFVPGSLAAAKVMTFGAGAVTMTRCRLGTLTTFVSFATASNLSLEDSYINAAFDTNQTITMHNWFGKLSMRNRNGGAITATNGVLVGPASGLTNCIYSNFDPGSGSPIIFNNNIVEMGSAFMSVDATNAGYMVAAGSEFHNNILFGGAAYDADLIAADSGGTVIQGTITSDPLIGAANTLLMADYAFASGSPAIGAATDGGDIGFGASDVAELVA